MDEQYFDAVVLMDVDGEEMVRKEIRVVAHASLAGDGACIYPEEPQEIPVPVAGTVTVSLHTDALTLHVPAPEGGTSPVLTEPRTCRLFGPSDMNAGDIVWVR